MTIRPRPFALVVCAYVTISYVLFLATSGGFVTGLLYIVVGGPVALVMAISAIIRLLSLNRRGVLTIILDRKAFVSLFIVQVVALLINYGDIGGECGQTIDCDKWGPLFFQRLFHLPPFSGFVQAIFVVASLLLPVIFWVRLSQLISNAVKNPLSAVQNSR